MRSTENAGIRFFVTRCGITKANKGCTEYVLCAKLMTGVRVAFVASGVSWIAELAIPFAKV